MIFDPEKQIMDAVNKDIFKFFNEIQIDGDVMGNSKMLQGFDQDV